MRRFSYDVQITLSNVSCQWKWVPRIRRRLGIKVEWLCFRVEVPLWGFPP